MAVQAQVQQRGVKRRLTLSCCFTLCKTCFSQGEGEEGGVRGEGGGGQGERGEEGRREEGGGGRAARGGARKRGGRGGEAWGGERGGGEGEGWGEGGRWDWWRREGVPLGRTLGEEGARGGGGTLGAARS